METVNYTNIQEKIEQTMDLVCEKHHPIIITRNNKQPVVIISLEDYQSLEETNYLLKSPKNAELLLESIAELESGKGLKKELIEE